MLVAWFSLPLPAAQNQDGPASMHGCWGGVLLVIGLVCADPHVQTVPTLNSTQHWVECGEVSEHEVPAWTVVFLFFILHYVYSDTFNAAFIKSSCKSL